MCLIEAPFSNDRTASDFDIPEHGLTMCAGVAKPTCRGRVRLTGPYPNDAVAVDANLLAHPDDVKTAIAAAELCRDIAGSNRSSRM